jgi:hypothetical protein
VFQPGGNADVAAPAGTSHKLDAVVGSGAIFLVKEYQLASLAVKGARLQVETLEVLEVDTKQAKEKVAEEEQTAKKKGKRDFQHTSSVAKRFWECR